MVDASVTALTAAKAEEPPKLRAAKRASVLLVIKWRECFCNDMVLILVNEGYAIAAIVLIAARAGLFACFAG